MSLEILISKYIDGDLTPQEDVKLREGIRDNAYSKAKFDASIELHHRIKHDATSIVVPKKLLRKTEETIQLKMLSNVLKDDAASIEVPDNLLRETEANVLMRILADKPQVIDLPKPAFEWYRYSAAAVLLVGLLLSFLFNISDQNHPREITFTDDIISNLVSDNTESVAFSPKSSNKVAKLVSTPHETNLKIALNENNVNVETFFEPEPLLVSSSETVEIQPDLASENSMFNSSRDIDPNINLQSNTTLNHNLGGQIANFNVSSNLSVNYFIEPFSGFKEVQLHTFMSYDFARNGFTTSNNTPVLNISQSISYMATDRISVGIEFGITEFNYDRRQNIILHNNTNQSDGPSVQLPTGSDDEFIVLPVYIETQRQFYWGTAVIDYALIKSNDFVLNGRLGLGGSNEGPLGFSRVYAQYDLFRYLSITLGAEGRLFVNELPNSEYTRSLRSSTSFVYGIRLKF